jgi:hypothetical protein
LYIGTNQGLFYKEYKGNGEFKFIDGTKGRFGLCLSMTEPCFADMIQEHLSLKRLQSKKYSKQELGNLNRFPVKKLYKQLLWDFGIGKGQQSVAFQE